MGNSLAEQEYSEILLAHLQTSGMQRQAIIWRGETEVAFRGDHQNSPTTNKCYSKSKGVWGHAPPGKFTSSQSDSGAF